MNKRLEITKQVGIAPYNPNNDGYYLCNDGQVWRFNYRRQKLVADNEQEFIDMVNNGKFNPFYCKLVN